MSYGEPSGKPYVSLDKQIDDLATFILENVPGEPSQNETAVECAVRLLREWGTQLGKVRRVNSTPKQLQQ